jgi:hypothetical protein
LFESKSPKVIHQVIGASEASTQTMQSLAS